MSEVVESPNVTILPPGPLLPTPEEPAKAAPEPVVDAPAEQAAAEEVPAEAEVDDQDRDEKGRFKPNRVQERIDELTRKAGEKEREAAYWRGVAEAAKPKDAEPAKADGKPKAEDFTSYDEYVDALTDWKVDQKLQTRDAKAEGAKRAETWTQRAEAAKATIPDLDSVLAQSVAPMSQAMAEVLRDAEHGPELAYHLAKNPAESERIARLSPMAAARELGKLEASLTTPTQAPAPPAPKRVTNAPAPPTPIGSGRSTEGSPGNMSMPEYREYRKKHGLH